MQRSVSTPSTAPLVWRTTPRGACGGRQGAVCLGTPPGASTRVRRWRCRPDALLLALYSARTKSSEPHPMGLSHVHAIHRSPSAECKHTKTAVRVCFELRQCVAGKEGPSRHIAAALAHPREMLRSSCAPLPLSWPLVPPGRPQERRAADGVCERKRCAARRARTGAPTPAAQKRAPSRAREGAETASLGCHSQRKVTDHSGQHASRQGLFLSQAGVAATLFSAVPAGRLRAAAGSAGFFQRDARSAATSHSRPQPRCALYVARASDWWRASRPAGQHQVFVVEDATSCQATARRGAAAQRCGHQLKSPAVMFSPPPRHSVRHHC